MSVSQVDRDALVKEIVETDRRDGGVRHRAAHRARGGPQGRQARELGASPPPDRAGQAGHAAAPARHPCRRHHRRPLARFRSRQEAGADRCGEDGRRLPRYRSLRFPGARIDARRQRVRRDRRAPVHPLPQRSERLFDDPRRQSQPGDPATMSAITPAAERRSASRRKRRRRTAWSSSRRPAIAASSNIGSPTTACSKAMRPRASPIPAMPRA